ncbi:hypothetical protein OQA88_2032 [Cercophora sp. LCS_1]
MGSRWYDEDGEDDEMGPIGLIADVGVATMRNGGDWISQTVNPQDLHRTHSDSEEDSSPETFAFFDELMESMENRFATADASDSAPSCSPQDNQSPYYDFFPTQEVNAMAVPSDLTSYDEQVTGL